VSKICGNGEFAPGEKREGIDDESGDDVKDELVHVQ